MPKHKQSAVRFEELHLLESESEGEDFSDDESAYEPTAEEIAAADLESYELESGESVEDLDLDVREAAVENQELLYTSKDSKIIYSTQPNAQCHLRSMNTIPGPTIIAVNRCTNILNSFLLFLEPIEKDVMALTNLYGIQTYKNDWSDLNVEEIRAYFGLMLFAGVFRSHGEELRELWDDAMG